MIKQIDSSISENAGQLIYQFDELGGVEAFSPIITGSLTWFTDYTREGDATAELPDGSPVTVAQDIPPFEYDSGQKLFRQSYSTDNPGTTSLQINDIETGAYEFNGTSDRITLDNPVILGTSDFNFKFTGRPTDITNRSITGELENGAFIVRINSGGTISIIESGVSTVYTSTLTVAADSDVDLEYNRLYSGTSTLTVNGTSESVTDNRNYNGQNGILFSRLVGEYFEGYIFTAKLIVDSVTNFDYSFNQYRRDTEIVDRSGNGNHGTSARTVNNLLVENQGFGIVGEDARKPFTYVTEDPAPVSFKGGLREIFYGAATGVESVINGGFDSDANWAKDAAWSISAGKARAINAGFNSNILQNIGYTEGTLVRITADITVSSGNISFWLGGTSIVDFRVSPIYTDSQVVDIYVVSTGTDKTLYIRALSSTATNATIDNVSVREVRPAEGTILFKNLTLHDTATDVTLLEGQNGTAVVWFDSATSKIKITDGTNTAESANTVSQGVNIPELRIVLNETEMWITDSTQGTKVTFAGYLPELGNRALAVSDDEYLTVGTVQFLDEVL